MLKLLVIFAAFLPLSLHADQVRWHQPAFISQAFMEVALRNEYTQRGNFVRKWKKPVRIWIDHQVPDKQMHTGLVQMHIAHLREITGHSIDLVKVEREANLKLVFTRQSKWRQRVGEEFGANAVQHVKGAVCMANFRVDGQYEIKKAVVIIPVDQARMHGKLVSCVVEEITQVLGLPNDSERAYPSIFNDKTPESLLSGLDYLLLKALYNDAIEPGMTAAEVAPILHNLIHRWQKDGTIQSAAQAVKTGELYPLLGY